MGQGTCGWASLAAVDNVFGVAQRGRDLYFQLLLGAPAPLILLLLRCRPSFRRAGSLSFFSPGPFPVADTPGPLVKGGPGFLIGAPAFIAVWPLLAQSKESEPC